MTISTQVRAQAASLTVDLPPQPTPHPHETGFRVAALEIAQGVASRAQAQQRGIFPGDQSSRIDWDQGYEACVCAYRLGHNIQEMVAAEFFDASLYSTAFVVQALLDGGWPLGTRMDPRTP